jgi:thioesterase domain-containing protein/aryl carrier-like protein
VLATIENFVMRKVPAAFVHEPRVAAAPAPPAERRPETPSEMALRQGMTPAEGLDALDRMLAVDFSPQVVACTLPLRPWLAQLDREARATLSAGGEDESTGPVFTRPSVSATFAPPRDEVERELALLWKGLLGVADVGINDDFFELGGQSLVAVRLFQRMTKKWGVDLPLATLFQAPTIAECAAVLRSALGIAPPGEQAEAAAADGVSVVSITPAKPAFRSLVEVQRGRGRVPFFCVHGAGGNVLNFRDLAKAMPDDQPFYGLQAAGVDGVSPPHTTIEEMAEAYLSEIRVVQPEGPYLLGGYSGGGIVAFEMARKLTAAGQEVALLAFIDTFLPQRGPRQITFLNRLERLQREGLAYLKVGMWRQRDKVKVAREDREIDEHLSRGEAVPLHLRELYLWRNFERAQAKHDLQPWNGRAILWRASKADPFFDGAGPAYGWDRLALGGVEVITMPGNHSTLLIGANAELMMKELNAAIERAVPPGAELVSAAGLPMPSKLAS